MKPIEIFDIDKIENSPSVRYGHSANTVGKSLYIFGGCTMDGRTFLNELVVFDLENMKWVKTIEADDGIDGRHFHTCEATSNDMSDAKLIFFGGKSNGYKNDVFSFDIANEKWHIYEHRFKNSQNLKSCVNKDHHPPTPRYGHSSCFFNERIFIFGGYDKNAFSKNDLYCFNFKTNMWKKFLIAKIPRRFHHSGVLIGSNYFVLGGVTSSLKPLSDVHRFDFSKLRNLTSEDEKKDEFDDDDHAVEAFELSIENPLASYGHRCFFWDDRIYLFGGRDEEKDFRHLLRLEHGKGNLKWVVDESNKELLVDESRLFMSYSTINIYDNKILLFGGQPKKRAKKAAEEEDEESTDEEVEGEEEERYESDKISYDAIFLIFEYLGEKDLARICISSKLWTFSIASRSDRIWERKYRKAVTKSSVNSYQMKLVKRRSTCYDKYVKLRHFEHLIFLESEKLKQGTWRRYKGTTHFEGNREIDNIKLVMNGDGAVGKTCMLIVYASEDHKFPTEYVPTVFDNYNASVMVNGRDVGLGLWDTAGEEDYDELRPLSYTGSDIFFICASVANPVSVSNIKYKWVPEVRKHSKAPFFIVLTKSDLRGDKEVKMELEESNQDFVKFSDVVQLAKEVKAAGVFETSSFTGVGIKEVFDEAINQVMFGSISRKEKCGIM